MVRVLLIGGSGFVGRNLSQRLQGENHEVFVIDRVEDPNQLLTVQLIRGDAQDPQFLTDVLGDVRPQTVYHLAANSDISAGVQDAALDFGDTLMTTVAVRIAVAKSPVDKLIFASSSAIFGHSDAPLSEEMEQIPSPASTYGKAKLTSEYVLESLAREAPGLPILIVRFPNVVGPLATHGVVFDFVRRLLDNPHRLDVLGDGNQTKPYVHVAELLDGISFFEAQLAPGITRVNIGPPDLVSVRDIACQVCQALNVEPDIRYQSSPYGWPGDVPRYQFDTSKMRDAGFNIDTPSSTAVRRAAEELALEWGA